MRRITIDFIENAKGDVEISFDLPREGGTANENTVSANCGIAILALLQSSSIGSAIAAGGKNDPIPSVEELKQKAHIEVDIRRAGA